LKRRKVERARACSNRPVAFRATCGQRMAMVLEMLQQDVEVLK